MAKKGFQSKALKTFKLNEEKIKRGKELRAAGASYKDWIKAGIVPIEEYELLLKKYVALWEVHNSYSSASAQAVNAEFSRLEKHSFREVEVQKRREKIIEIINNISPRKRKQMNKTDLRYYIIEKMGLKESEDEKIRKDLQYLQRQGNKF